MFEGKGGNGPNKQKKTGRRIEKVNTDDEEVSGKFKKTHA